MSKLGISVRKNYQISSIAPSSKPIVYLGRWNRKKIRPRGWGGRLSNFDFWACTANAIVNLIVIVTFTRSTQN